MCRPVAEWEASAGNVPKSTRVVIIRTGIVLARDGGVLGRMLPIFELFAGEAVYACALAAAQRPALSMSKTCS